MDNRRVFLKKGGVALFGLGLGGIPNFVKAAVAQQKTSASKKILVCIFQRGAMDGLMAVSPFTDQNLKKARPNIFMEPGTGKSLIDLDGKFGLHPGFKGFDDLFKSRHLAIVHGMGSPNKTRSHFDAQDYMESGTPYQKGTDSGWLNRALQQKKDNSSVFQGVSLTSSLPRSFYGDYPCLAVSNFNDFKINTRSGKAITASTATSFEELYDLTADELQKQTSKESFEAMKMVEKLNFKNYTPDHTAKYPASPLGNSLKQIAQLIKSDVGLEIAFAESTGWDTHFNQGTENGIFARNANDLSSAVSALWQDVEAYQNEVVIMTMTEFGRTVKQNGTNGTDHGRASCSFIIGSHVSGGKVYHKIPELSIENLEDGRDLPVTIDFREVFNEVALKHLHVKDTQKLFPDWKGENLTFIS
ncbi:MAG: DUF1501 domain-containing protein [Saprospiraceae bacterium]